MNKSEIRKTILKIRKQNSYKDLKINYKDLFKILRKEKISGKIVGGYYPYNFEIDDLKILEKLEKQKYRISLPKIKKNFKWIFLVGA